MKSDVGHPTRQSLTKTLRLSQTLSFAALALTLNSPFALAQNADVPRTEHGHPDFQGFYTFRTITPLNRPPELADKEVLTPEEAAEWEAF
jgi:hypothetical protein